LVQQTIFDFLGTNGHNDGYPTEVLIEELLKNGAPELVTETAEGGGSGRCDGDPRCLFATWGLMDVVPLVIYSPIW
jgi:hypothetical protein